MSASRGGHDLLRGWEAGIESPSNFSFKHYDPLELQKVKVAQAIEKFLKVGF